MEQITLTEVGVPRDTLLIIIKSNINQRSVSLKTLLTNT